MDRTCNTCRYFEDNGDCGACHRHAPRMAGELQNPAAEEAGHWQNAVWPWIEYPNTDWCGEHRPITKDQNTED